MSVPSFVVNDDCQYIGCGDAAVATARYCSRRRLHRSAPRRLALVQGRRLAKAAAAAHAQARSELDSIRLRLPSRRTDQSTGAGTGEGGNQKFPAPHLDLLTKRPQQPQTTILLTPVRMKRSESKAGGRSGFTHHQRDPLAPDWRTEPRLNRFRGDEGETDPSSVRTNENPDWR